MRDECEDFTTKIVFEKPLSTTSYSGVLTDESSFIAFLHKHNIKVDEESLSFAQPSIKSKYVYKLELIKFPSIYASKLKA